MLLIKNCNYLPALKVFNSEAKTIIYNLKNDSTGKICVYIKLENENFIEQILHSLFEMNIQSVLVEGGAKTLQSFIDDRFVG